MSRNYLPIGLTRPTATIRHAIYQTWYKPLSLLSTFSSFLHERATQIISQIRNLKTRDKVAWGRGIPRDGKGGCGVSTISKSAHFLSLLHAFEPLSQLFPLAISTYQPLYISLPPLAPVSFRRSPDTHTRATPISRDAAVWLTRYQ